MRCSFASCRSPARRHHSRAKELSMMSGSNGWRPRLVAGLFLLLVALAGAGQMASAGPVRAAGGRGPLVVDVPVLPPAQFAQRPALHQLPVPVASKGVNHASGIAAPLAPNLINSSAELMA